MSNNCIKIVVLFSFIEIFTLQITTADTTDVQCIYVVDTFFVVKYGKEIGMLAPPASNPFLFRATNNSTYLFQPDGGVLVFDRYGKFLETKKVPLKKPTNLLSVYYWDCKLFLVDIHKIYCIDYAFNLIDSINYIEGCNQFRQLGLDGYIYFGKDRCYDTILQFDIKNRLFSDKSYLTIWGVESNKCVLKPFPFDSLWGSGYNFYGASKKIVIAFRNVPQNEGSVRIHTLFNTAKCMQTDLPEFDFHVNPTISPQSAFQFIDDTTAIFNVRYQNEKSSCTDSSDCEEYRGSPSPDPNGIIRYTPRNCVFYRIKFLNN